MSSARPPQVPSRERGRRSGRPKRWTMTRTLPTLRAPPLAPRAKRLYTLPLTKVRFSVTGPDASTKDLSGPGDLSCVSAASIPFTVSSSMLLLQTQVSQQTCRRLICGQPTGARVAFPGRALSMASAISKPATAKSAGNLARV